MAFKVPCQHNIPKKGRVTIMIRIAHMSLGEGVLLYLNYEWIIVYNEGGDIKTESLETDLLRSALNWLDNHCWEVIA